MPKFDSLHTFVSVPEVSNEWEKSISDVQEANKVALKVKEDLESKLKLALDIQSQISQLEKSDDYLPVDLLDELHESYKKEKVEIENSEKLVVEIKLKEEEIKKAR